MTEPKPERVGDAPEDVEEMEGDCNTDGVEDLAAQILKRPEVLANLSGTLHSEMLQVLAFRK